MFYVFLHTSVVEDVRRLAEVKMIETVSASSRKLLSTAGSRPIQCATGPLSDERPEQLNQRVAQLVQEIRRRGNRSQKSPIVVRFDRFTSSKDPRIRHGHIFPEWLCSSFDLRDLQVKWFQFPAEAGCARIVSWWCSRPRLAG
jgi:hypothetical protein